MEGKIGKICIFKKYINSSNYLVCIINFISNEIDWTPKQLKTYTTVTKNINFKLCSNVCNYVCVKNVWIEWIVPHMGNFFYLLLSLEA